LIDIDSFKTINELYGVDTGNQVLINLSKLLKEFGDINSYEAYRISGDEFALLSLEYQDLNSHTENIKKLLSDINRSHIYVDSITDTIEFNVTVGASFEKDNSLAKADMALFYAKKNKLSYIFYENSIDIINQLEKNRQWEREIRNGLLSDRFIPFYQPIFNKDRSILKYETLIRLKIVDKDSGGVKYITPFHFLDIASDTKQYLNISRVVIKKSFEQFKDQDMDFTINLSYQDIQSSMIKRELKLAINNYNLGNRVIFEILESESIENYEILTEFISDFRKFGVRFAIDDFGTGYSNFSHILDLSPDYIKIDGGLIKNIDTDKKSYELVKAIMIFAKELNIEVIAEHIHSKEVFDICNSIGVEQYQGFYLGMPKESLII